MTTQTIDKMDQDMRHDLLRRLRRLRATGAAVSLVAGLSRAALSILAVLLSAIALDWLLRMPGPIRLALLLAAAALTALTVHRHVLARLRLPSLPRVARQVQGDVDGPPDCLASGVEFALRGHEGFLADRTIARSAEMARRLSPLRLARWRWMVAWLVPAVAAVVLLVAAWPAIGWWVERGLLRLAWPVARADWPRRMQVLSDLSGRTILVPAGEPVTLQARIARGPASAETWLVLDDAGRVRRVGMTDAGDGRRTAAIRPLDSATFWFEAGDDSTRSTPGRLRVVPRPAVSRAEILVQPPGYTGQPAGRIALSAGPVQVPEASRLDLRLWLSKPLAAVGDQPRAIVALVPADVPGTQPVETLDVRFGDDRRQVVARWQCTRDSLVRADFVDTDGLANAPFQPWRIVARADQPPVVQVSSPPDGLEVTPAAVVPLQATVTDDYGLQSVHLAWRITRAVDAAAQSPGAEPSQPAALEHLQSIPIASPPPGGQPVSLPIDWPWPLQALALQPGDRLTWSLLAQDTLDLAGRRRDPTRSPPRTIRVVNPGQLLEAVLSRLSESRARIARMAQQQRDLAGALRAAATQPQPAAGLAQSRRFAGQQAGIARQARDAAAELAAAAQRLRSNHAENEPLADAAASTGRRLSRIQSREMADVQRNLQGASPQIVDAARSADAAACDLADLLQRTAGWTSIESAALALQDMIDRQKALQDQAAEVAATSLGRPFDQLPAIQRDSLGRIAQDQRALSQGLDRLRRDIRSQAGAAAQTQAAAAKMPFQESPSSRATGSLPASAAGVPTGGSSSLPAVRSASEDTGGTVPGAAGSPVPREAEGSSAGASAHGTADERQSDLAASPQPAASFESDRQARLAAAAASLDRPDAVAEMAAAADRLADNVTMDAQQRQQAARQAMQRALADLQGRQPGREDAATSAGLLARRVRDLAGRQETLREWTGDINARRDANGTLDRADLLRLAQAGQAQSDLAGQVQQARQFADAEAVQRLLDALARRMQSAGRQMQSGASGQPVLQSQQQAAQALSDLADALDRASQAGQQDPQANRQDPAGKAAAVRKASELEGLYLLQQDLLMQTRQAGPAGPPGPGDTPAADEVLQDLARRQQDVRDLARRVLGEQ